MTDRLSELIEELADRFVARLLEEFKPEDILQPWMNVKEAAVYLGSPESRIYDLVASGKLQSAKDGSRLKFRREWIDEALDT